MDEFDQVKWKHEIEQRAAERAHDMVDDYCRQVNEATIQSGQNTLRMTMLINGGAAVAVLAFLGSLAGKVDMDQVSRLASTIVWFASGVAASVVGMAAAYFTNYSHVSLGQSRDKVWEAPYFVDTDATWWWNVASNIFHVIAVLAAIVSIGLFIVGMLVVHDGVSQIPAPIPQIKSAPR